MKYEIKTTPSTNGDILQEVLFHGDDTLITVLHRNIVHTQEQQLRQALIALGWTPPLAHGEPPR